ncbi:hypothetical protein HAX54_047632, partial [Datura stramonium]|nr:hypothetical protein [Datura stramonium]
KKIRCCRPGGWVTKEVTSHQVSDNRHSWRHPFDDEVDSRMSGNIPSLNPLGSNSPTLRVTENLMDHQ